MAGVLFGEQGISNITFLSTELRRKTLDLACRMDNNTYPNYTPWLCIRPLLSNSLSKHELCYRGYTPGEIITDKHHLLDIESFLEEHQELTLSNLIGSREDWRVLLDCGSRESMILELNKAINLLLDSFYLKCVYPSLVDLIIPLEQPRARGWSCQYARGAVFLGFPSAYSQLNLALDLAHEMGHQALVLLQSADDLIASDWNTPVYSEVRRVNRPAFQSLHAAAAIAFMVTLSKDIGHPEYTHPEFPYSLATALGKAVIALRQSCQFTSLGKSLIDDFELLAET